MKTELYDFIVDTLIKTRIAAMGWRATHYHDSPACVDGHTLTCIHVLCDSAIEERKDIYKFGQTCEGITDSIAQLIRDKEGEVKTPAPAPEPTRWADDEALIAGPVDGHPVHQEDEQK